MTKLIVSRDIYGEINSSNNDEQLILIHSFNLPPSINTVDFNNTYHALSHNCGVPMVLEIFLSSLTYRQARVSSISVTDSESERQLKIREMLDQPGFKIEILSYKNDFYRHLSTHKIVNMGQSWKIPILTHLADEDGKVMYEQDTSIYARIKNDGYGLLGSEDNVYLTGTYTQTISVIPKNIAVHRVELTGQ